MAKQNQSAVRVTGDIRKLNQRLLGVCERIAVAAHEHDIIQFPPGKILLSFFQKAVNTFEAIEVLKKERLIEEAWILLRVLLETHVNFFYFIRGDGEVMTRRYMDAAMLDKSKQLREVNFYEGTAAETLHRRTDWEQAESDIKGRYSTKEVEALKRNGFTGLSFQARSKAVGLKTMYEHCYRIASRSVHMFDPAETLLYSEYAFPGQRKEKQELLRLRRQQLESNQNMLLGRMSFIMSELTNQTLLSAELTIIGMGYEKFRVRTTGVVVLEPNETPDPPGTLRVWRE
jgi:hypothetical protein